MSIATSNETEATCSILKQLIQACVDSERCFRAAMSDVESVGLRELFASFSRLHADFVLVLDAEVERLSGTSDVHGTFAGTLFRGWMNLKSEVDGFDEASVLSDCERTEGKTLEVYRQTLEAGLPHEIETLVIGEYVQIQKAYETLRTLAQSSRA